MSIQDDLKNAMVAAMKAKDQIRLSTIRLVRAAIKNAEIEKRKELSDSEVLSLLQKLSKQRRESIEQYQKGGRNDLVEKEKAELEILAGFLPEPLSEAELMKIIEETAGEVNAQSMKDMGALMKAVRSKVEGRADGRLVSDLVKKKLG